jgi:hypothetical protein
LTWSNPCRRVDERSCRNRLIFRLYSFHGSKVSDLDRLDKESTDSGVETMWDLRWCLLIIALVSTQGVGQIAAQIVSPPYQYAGGRFTIRTVFNFDTGIETDAVARTTRLEPILTITNSRTGRSITSSFLSENDFISTIEGNRLIGNEIVPGQLNPRTNTGIVTIDASNLGSGPLVFTVTGVSELTARAPAPIRNEFGGPYYVWTVRPQSITPSLSPYIPPPPSPVSNPTPVPVSTNIHAVIISGRSDPAKIVTSRNVTLTGGVVALGKDPAPPAVPSAWTTGLYILPDEALLTGAKIPPVTPNIVDVRIVKHEVVGDLAAPSASP